MLKIAICDDEKIFVDDTTNQIEKILDAEKIEYDISSTTNPIHLIEALAKDQDAYDIIFLDIMMSEFNGIQIAKAIRKTNNDVAIVFITSSKEYTLEGYSVYPLHYLMKPLKQRQLREVLLKFYRKSVANPTIAVPTKKGTSILNVDEILYAEMQNRTLCIFMRGGVVESTCPIVKFCQISAMHDIIRCHRGFLANLKHVSNIKRYHFILKDGTTVPIGRTYYDESISSLLNFVS